MKAKKTLTARLAGVSERGQVFHSSGYAQVQNGGSFGAASGESFAERRAVDERRRFVQGYNNARIMRGTYAVRRARTETAGMVGSRGSSGGSSGISGGSRGSGVGGGAGRGGSRGGGVLDRKISSRGGGVPSRKVVPIRMK